MLFYTIVDSSFEGAKHYECYCKAMGSENSEKIELYLAEMEYDEAFAEKLSAALQNYSIHTVFTYDYESSSDAGDGRDDYYTEENDEHICLNQCIVKDGQFFGVMCESFERQGFVLVDYPVMFLGHPKNYGGKNYHFYRTIRFELLKK